MCASRLPSARRGALVATIVLLTSLALGCGGRSAVGGTASAATTRAATTAVTATTASTAAPAATTAAKPTPVARALASWPLFGLTPQRGNATSRATGITAANVGELSRRRVAVPGTVDSSPIALHGLAVMTTTYGRTIAVALANGQVRWTFSPPRIARWEGTAQITNASPAADPSGRWVYTASPDGRIHKLAVATGHEATGRWHGGVSVTRDPVREKVTSSLNVDGRYVVVTTGGYVGDQPPYQGHVVTIDRGSGVRHAVFNSLCANRRGLIVPSSCASSDSAIWARSGAVVEPGGRGLLVATGNAPFDGRKDWGDSVLRLSPGALRLTASWTPSTQRELNQTDADLGSTAPALLGSGLYLQGGKDAKLHLLSSRSFHAPSARLGGDVATYPAPGNQQVFTTPAVWHHGGRTTVFVATGGGTTAYTLRGGRLHRLWANGNAGTSPVFAGGLLYVDDPGGAGLRVMRPGTGRVLATLPAGAGHWQSPIVLGGRIVLPEGNANDHAKTGTSTCTAPGSPSDRLPRAAASRAGRTAVGMKLMRLPALRVRRSVSEPCSSGSQGGDVVNLSSHYRYHPRAAAAQRRSSRRRTR